MSELDSSFKSLLVFWIFYYYNILPLSRWSIGNDVTMLNPSWWHVDDGPQRGCVDGLLGRSCLIEFPVLWGKGIVQRRQSGGSERITERRRETGNRARWMMRVGGGDHVWFLSATYNDTEREYIWRVVYAALATIDQELPQTQYTYQDLSANSSV